MGGMVQRQDLVSSLKKNWLLWEDCETVIKEAWSMDVGGMNGMARLKQKIEVCGVDLRE